jgi:hypothetical protein
MSPTIRVPFAGPINSPEYPYTGRVRCGGKVHGPRIISHKKLAMAQGGTGLTDAQLSGAVYPASPRRDEAVAQGAKLRPAKHHRVNLQLIYQDAHQLDVPILRPNLRGHIRPGPYANKLGQMTHGQLPLEPAACRGHFLLGKAQVYAPVFEVGHEYAGKRQP